MKKTGSILVADCGSTVTTVALLDVVNGRHRFVARGEAISTHGAPWSNVAVGVQEAVRQIEMLVGRTFLTSDGALIRPQQANGDGVDTFVAVSSAAPPMRVMLVGLTQDVSLASARRALSAANALIVGALATDDVSEHRNVTTRLEVLRQVQPDVVLIAGGTDDGATKPVLELAQLVALYSQLMTPQDRPAILYAGNAQLAEQVRQFFAGLGELRVASNVRPTLEVENPEPASYALDALYRDYWLARVPGMQQLSEWGGTLAHVRVPPSGRAAAKTGDYRRPVSPTSRSFGHLIRYVGERYGMSVVGVDLGSSRTVLAEHTDNKMGNGGSGHYDGGQPQVITRADLGIGVSVSSALAHIPMERIVRWLPFAMDADQARDILLNKGLHPHSVPQTSDDLLLEYALAREVMRQTVSTQTGDGMQAEGLLQSGYACRWDLIIGAGRMLTRTPDPGYAGLLLLDALEPVGVSKLALDTSGIAGLLGAVAASDPLAAVELVEYDAFLTLGTLVALAGTAVRGNLALRVSIRYRDGRVIHDEVPYGALKVIPLAPGELARLELHPARGLDVGVDQPGLSAIAEAEGGPLGIVIDARGRPLSLPTDDGERYVVLENWLDAAVSQRQRSSPLTMPYVGAAH